MLKILMVAVMVLTVAAVAAGCVPPEGAEQPGFDWTLIIFLVLIFGVFYFLMIRPQRKRQKEHQSMMQELQKGDKVVTAGGIYGTIESISDDSVVMKLEGGTTIRVAKGSVIGRREQT
jgi:preprotein translocase subunit YajC